MVLVGVAVAVAGCAGRAVPGDRPPASLQPVVLTADGVATYTPSVQLIAPRNGSASFVLQASVPLAAGATLAVDSFGVGGNGTTAGRNGIAVDGYELLPFAVDLDRADNIRLTGSSAAVASLPRVLLPMGRSSGGFRVDPSPRSTRLFWFDVQVPPGTPPGRYSTVCSLSGTGMEAVRRVPITLEVSAVTLPVVPSLAIEASVRWPELNAAFPGIFDALPPRLMNRTDPAASRAVAVLDAVQRAAHRHRVALLLPDLEPTLKWASDGTPRLGWDDYDALVWPWLSGGAFADHQGAPVWSLPDPPQWQAMDARLHDQLRHNAATHFGNAGWLTRCTTDGSEPVHGLVAEAESTRSTPAPGWLDARESDALCDADEGQVRTWGWLAFLRHANQLRWGDALAAGSDSTNTEHAPWFVSGSAYGSAEPVLETVQLKWAREAEQDDELLLAAARHDPATVEQIARLLVKPLTGDSTRSSTDALWCGTTDKQAWQEATVAVAGLVTQPRANDPAPPPDLHALMEEARPVARVSGVRITPTLDGDNATATVDVHVLHPSRAASTDTLNWGIAPPGWVPDVSRAAVRYPAATADVGQATLTAAIDLGAIARGQPTLVEVLLETAATFQPVQSGVVVPVALCVRRKTPVTLDGSLADWSADDALLLDEPMVAMWSRPNVRRPTPALAAQACSLYAAWNDDGLLVAFRLRGIAPSSLTVTRNFVQYDRGRAWGEDLAELLIQPVTRSDSPAPLLHVVCKPGGSWVEQAAPSTRDDGSETEPTWTPTGNAAVHYASTVDPAQQVWRGEVQIPWATINESPGAARPTLLRFNFAQHRESTGESASWAGPVDSGRDPATMGLLCLRAADAPVPRVSR